MLLWKHVWIAWVVLSFPLVSGYGVPFPSDRDQDQDGIVDIDERGYTLSVPAGPSGDSIFIIPTDLIIQAGQSIIIAASGTIDAGGGNVSGPDGLSLNPFFQRVKQDAPFLSLLGRIGSGKWFLIGSSLILNTTESGQLFLTVNEVLGAYNNNSGAFSTRFGKNIGTNPLLKDTDGDLFDDGVDVFPLDRTEWVDTDGDGIGNNEDLDDDGDTLPDIDELYGKLSIPAGATNPITIIRTGVKIAPDDLLSLTATGTITSNAGTIVTSSPEGRPDIDTSTVTTVDNRYAFLALLGRIENGPWRKIGMAGQIKSDSIINGDFEGGHLGGWTIQSGQAFNFQPTLGPNRGQNTHQGNYWIGTYERYQGLPGQQPGDIQGDIPQGILASTPFTIYADAISFLVGGGSYAWPNNPTSVNLEIQNSAGNWNMIYTASGQDSESMRRVVVDVRDRKYQNARVRVYDLNSSLFGHINFDDLYQSDLAGNPVRKGTVRGELIMAVNDIVGDFANNSGKFDVTVGDGITSNPLLKDTDGDGFDDNVEVQAKTDPNDPNDFPKPDITVIPTSLDFGNVDVSLNRQRSIEIANSSIVPLDIYGIDLTPGTSPDFTITSLPPTPLTLQGGERLFLSIRYTPSDQGVDTGSLEILAGDPDEPTTTISLIGTGLLANIEVDPVSQNFNNVRIGQTAQADITVRNTGNKDLVVSNIQIVPQTPGFALVNLPAFNATITPGNPLVFQAVFSPSAPDPYSAVIRVSSSDPDQPQIDVPLNGQGITPEIHVFPLALNFGSVTAGGQAIRSATLENLGNMNLLVSDILLSPTGSADFKIQSAPSVPDVVPPLEQRVIEIAYEPGGIGADIGTLIILSDDDDESRIEISLTGMVPAPTPTFTETPAPTETASPTITATPSESPTQVPTETPTQGPTETPTLVPTFTETPSPTSTGLATETPTLTPTESPTPEFSPTPTLTGVPTETPTETPTLNETRTPTPTENPIAAFDLNGDQNVDEKDLFLLLDAAVSGTAAGDVNNDGVTDYVDLFLFQSHWIEAVN